MRMFEIFILLKINYKVKFENFITCLKDDIFEGIHFLNGSAGHIWYCLTDFFVLYR